MTYEIRLPEHDFVVATLHKLTPSVYAACEIMKYSSNSDFNISYSGPMHVVIRNSKHDSSTAYKRGRNFDKLLTNLTLLLKRMAKMVKPIVISFVGEPDENPRFSKTLEFAMDHLNK